VDALPTRLRLFRVAKLGVCSPELEKASELDSTMAPAAYNVGLCYVKLGYYREAPRWYEEYLRRNPTAQDRAEVETTIKKLKNL
jgi:tetratricopeptide (TPR) repeat protein